MIETTSTLEINEKLNEDKKEFYCKINLYTDCDEIKLINKKSIGTLVRRYKSRDKTVKYVVVAGSGFLRSYVKMWDASFQNEIKKIGVECIYLNGIIGLNPVFAAFNENSAFILPEKDIRRIDKIWQI